MVPTRWVRATGPNGRIADRMCIHPGYVRHCLVEPSTAIGPVEELPFPDDYFDVVISSDVMQHVRDVCRAHGSLELRVAQLEHRMRLLEGPGDLPPAA